MTAIGDFFGGSDAVKQIVLWSIVSPVVSTLLQPMTTQLLNDVQKRNPLVPLSPAELALGVLRGNLEQDLAAGAAAESGVPAPDFQTMIDNTGEPISPQEALSLYRRGLIVIDRLDRAIRQSRIRNEWIPEIHELAYEPLSAADAVDAAVQAQLPFDTAREKAKEAGLLETDFQTLFNIRGRPPGPAELLELVRRGIIPQDGLGPDVLSLQQGIAESAVKTKWTPAYDALLHYLPPPRTITALERQGVITPEQAQHLYQQAGLSPDLAAAYSASATSSKLTKQREITESQVLTMYMDQFLTAPQATTMLVGLGYTTAEVDTLLAWEDAKRELALIKGALSRVQTLYVNRKIGTTSATHALNALGISSEQQAHLFTTWSLERSLKVPTLTAAQIASGVEYQVITTEQGLQALSDLGYSPWDAWFYLSQHLHAQLPNEPPMDTPTGQLP